MKLNTILNSIKEDIYSELLTNAMEKYKDFVYNKPGIDNIYKTLDLACKVWIPYKKSIYTPFKDDLSIK